MIENQPHPQGWGFVYSIFLRRSEDLNKFFHWGKDPLAGSVIYD